MRDETLRALCKTPAWRKLKSNEQVMLLYLGTHIDDRGLYWGGHKRLADALGVHKKSVKRTLDSLKTAGFIEQRREGVGHISSEYKLWLPESSGQDGHGEGVNMGIPTDVTSEGVNMPPNREHIENNNNREHIENIRGITPYNSLGTETSQASVSEGLRSRENPGSETVRVLVEAAPRQTLPRVVELSFDKHLEPLYVPPKLPHNAETRKSEEEDEAETEEAGERFLDKEDGITPEMRAARGPMADLDAILQTKPDKGREGT